MAGNEVTGVRVTATGTVLARPTRVLGISYLGGATAGTIVLRDGGAGGTIRLTNDTSAGTLADGVDIPGDGILFTTDVHATLTTVTAITVYCT